MREEKKKLIEKYDKTADGYDELYFNEQLEKYKSALGALENFSMERRRIGDIGCGTGLLLRMMPSNAELIGADLSLKSLLHARMKGYQHIVLADAEYPPFRDESLDIIFAFTMIHHVCNPLRVVKEFLSISRHFLVISILKKGTRKLMENLLDKFCEFCVPNSDRVKDLIVVIEKGKLNLDRLEKLISTL